MREPPEIAVDFPRPLLPLSHVRSTVLLSSVQALKVAGHFERYLPLVPKEHHEHLYNSIAGVWVPVAAALAHYRACDALQLTPEEQLAVGRVTGQNTREHLLRVAGMVSRGLGVTPWTIFGQFPRFWQRMFDGAGLAIYKLGPKEADIVYASCALLESPYFRSALRGVAIALLEAATRRCMMTELKRDHDPHRARYRISWV